MKGRGALSNPANRFHKASVERFVLPPDALETLVTEQQAKSILARNQSPDVPFDRSINAYRGCEHGCVYCFARPTHAFLDLSPGLDFETLLFAKTNAADLLRKELSKPGYACKPIAIGTNTDPYQPIEKRYQITRQILEVLLEFRHPVTILTKGNLITRDLDLLVALHELRLTRVMLSLPTLDRNLKRTLEPRAPSTQARLDTVSRLAKAGVRVGVMVAPVIPKLTDHELEAILQQARAAGATTAGYVVLRLPLEVAPLFEEWLHTHQPGRASAVKNILRQMHGGAIYDPRWNKRQRGEGVYADLLARRFATACRKLGLNRESPAELRTDLFRVPGEAPQMSLAL